MKDRERARKWHKDNIDHKNNADLNTKLIAKQSEKIIFLEAELCKAHEHEIMAERNASNEMYGGINQKSQSTSYAAPTASSLAKGGPSIPASLMANSNKRKSNTATLVSAVHYKFWKDTVDEVHQVSMHNNASSNECTCLTMI